MLLAAKCVYLMRLPVASCCRAAALYCLLCRSLHFFWLHARPLCDCHDCLRLEIAKYSLLQISAETHLI